MDNTRVRILRETLAWIKDVDAKQICWIDGVAGSGKTSIAKTVCERARTDDEITFGGSFFCSRSSGLAAQRDIRCIVPTLARLLALESVEFCQCLAENIHEGIQDKEVKAQVEQLLLTPLLAMKGSQKPILFVIDALDECGGDTDDGLLDDTKCRAVVTSMLEALFSLTRSDPKLPIKILVTSRPETQIRDTSISNENLSQIMRLHAVGFEEINADIRRFIAETLDTKLNQSKYRAMITDEDIEHLSRLCDGLFIVAATALGHTFGKGGTDGAISRFKKLLNDTRDSLHVSAAAPLDRMYALILADVAKVDESEATELLSVQRLLASLLSARMMLSITVLGDLLGLGPYEVRASLSGLHSVVHVPEADDVPGLRTVHASFGDYLLGRAPSHLRIPRSFGHDILAHGCLGVMEKQLRFNVSQSASSHDSNPSTLPYSITFSLAYACLQWVYHLTALPDLGDLDVEISVTFRPRLLAWLEVMSLLREVWRATRMLFIAAATVGTRTNTELTRFLRDANSFVASSHEAIEWSAPHIYLSALPFADKSSLVYKDFASRCTGLITVDTFNTVHHGGSAIIALTGHGGAVNSVAYAPDGRLLVTGSEDGTVRVWNTLTGEEALPKLQICDALVSSVDFASDNKIAFGTNLGAVLVYYIVPGQMRCQRLQSHAGRVIFVAFFSDSTRLASVSEDIVRIWDTETGEQLREFVPIIPSGDYITSLEAGRFLMFVNHTGEIWWYSVTADSDEPSSESWKPMNMKRELLRKSSRINCITYSPDGQSLVMAVGWDVRLGTLQPDQVSWVNIGSHLDEVRSVVFSPDGLYIASASDDATIRIWSTGSGHSTFQPPSARVSSITSVAVSRDGAFIASSSTEDLINLNGSSVQNYGSIWVWNAHTGQAIFSRDVLEILKIRLYELTGGSLSVAISPSESFIASAQGDNTIRLWDTLSGTKIGELMYNSTDVINNVTFSHDGRWLASASHDNHVLMLGFTTGQELAVGPLKCRNPVWAVVFSPDDGLIAAGDQGGYIYVWSTDTGMSVNRPLQANEMCVQSLAFSPDGARIVSGGHDNMVRIWDISTGEPIFVLQGHTDVVGSVAWSSDGRFIGTCSNDRTAPSRITRFWTFDGEFIGRVSGDLFVRLWDARTGASLATLSGHDYGVSSVTFTPDGRSIVSGSVDATIRKWDVDAACKIASKHRDDPVAALAYATLDRGWLVGPFGELLLWVPVQYRRYIQMSPCTLLISGSRVVIGVGDSGLHAGSDWSLCWNERQR